MFKIPVEVVDYINSWAKKCSWVEFYFWDYNYKERTFILVGSEDASYYHQIEITFHEVFAISCNSFFIVDTDKDFLFLIENNESEKIDEKFRVEVGNSVFKLVSEDNLIFYVVAQNITFEEKLVKYYKE